MWATIQFFAGASAWGVVGAIGACAIYDIDPDFDPDMFAIFSLIFAPAVGPFLMTAWVLWRLSAEGRHEKRRRKLERQREIEEEYDRMLEEVSE